MFQDHEGQWWMVFLGTRRYDNTNDHLGRETFLAPVSWKDDWPIVNDQKPVKLIMEVSNSKNQSFVDRSLSFSDNFDKSTLDKSFTFIRNPYPDTYSLTDRPGWLRINTSHIDLGQLDSPAWVGRRQQAFNCIFKTFIDFKPKHPQQEAGLTIHANDFVHAEIGITVSEEGKRVVICRVWRSDLDDLDELNVDKKYEIVTTEDLPDDEPIELQVIANPTTYQFGYVPKGEVNVKILGTMSAKWFKRTEPRRLHFTGVFAAMYCTDRGYQTIGHADFDYYSVAIEE